MSEHEELHHSENMEAIKALATRIGNLADQVSELSARTPTTEQWTAIKEILESQAAKKWLRGRFKTYGIGGLAMLASIYATREYLALFFNAVGRLLKP